ncbi:MAG: methylamine utilization protein [Aureliella sp.]
MNRLLIAAIVTVASQVHISAAEWADLKLTVTYDGPVPKLAALNPPIPGPCAVARVPNQRMIVGAGGQIANFALIMDMQKSKATDVHPDLVAPPPKPLAIDINNCAFTPHVAFARTGRRVIVTNKDACGHNVKVDPFSNKTFNSLVPVAGQIEVMFKYSERSDFTEVACTIHPWIRGWLIIRDHPYVGISGADGVVTIEKLPVGKVSFKLAHQNARKWISEGKIDGKAARWRSGYIELDLKPGLNEHTIELAPSLFR